MPRKRMSSKWISSNVSSSSSNSFESFHSDDLVSIKDLIDEQEKLKKTSSTDANVSNSSNHEGAKKVKCENQPPTSKKDSLEDKSVMYNYLNSTLGRKSGANIFPISPRGAGSLLVSARSRSESQGDLSELESKVQNMNLDKKPTRSVSEQLTALLK